MPNLADALFIATGLALWEGWVSLLKTIQACHVYHNMIHMRMEGKMRYGQVNAIAGRHESLLSLIHEGRFSSHVLAEKLGVSEQTIYRDIDFLKKKGHQIRAVRVAHNWAYRFVSDEETDDSRGVTP